MSFKRISDKRTIIIGLGLPIELDAVINESHNSITRFTRYPVEFGSLMSDHAQKEPIKIEMNTIITDTPINGTLNNANQGRSNIIYKQLNVWQTLRTPLVLVTGLRSYLNMYIEEMTANRDSNTGYSINLNIKFVEVELSSLGLLALAASLAVDTNIAYSVKNKYNLGLI